MIKPYLKYWGKADPKYPGVPKWHPLAYHCLDVAAVAAAWWDVSPVIRRVFLKAFNGNDSEVRAWVLFFVALHDIGKVDLRFQVKADEILMQSWSGIDLSEVDGSQFRTFDHGRQGFAWAIKECPQWAGIEMSYDIQTNWFPWLAAVTGHHGDLPEAGDPDREYAEEHLMNHDRDARREWVAALAALFLSPTAVVLDTPPPCESPAQALLAGFCAVCDWIGSNIEVSPYVEFNPGLGLDSYFVRRIDELKGQGCLSKFGLVRTVLEYQGLASLLKSKETPRGVQVRVDDLPCAPGLTLIEAPTGSGKTEAALAHAWRLLAAGLADSIIFALPTQATANAMLKRVESFANIAFQGSGANIVLAHGKRGLNPEFERLVNTGRKQSVQQQEDATAQCANWLAQSRKRIFLGQVGVCTVDQTLLSVLPVRHKFVRGFGLNKAVLIVDEVHAYDAYMHGLLAEELRRQKSIGGSAILLSATLPAGVRAKLFEAWDVAAPSDAPYPVLWAAGESGAEPIEVPVDQQPSRREVFVQSISLQKAMPDDAVLERIVEAAEGGARVAVVANLVDAAQHIARQLKERTAMPVDLFHARYRFADRQDKEQFALDNFGRDAVRQSGRILVATQVVEQSLDLDFDWMLTQICPVDLLFQRLGRLHRHERTRPIGYEVPNCTVMTVDDDDYGLHKLIYGNTRVLWRTSHLLSNTDRIVFPQAYREWIECVYKDEEWDDEPEAIIKDYLEYTGKQMAVSCEAKQMITTPRRPFGDDDVTITVKTRDGEMSLTVLPMRVDGSMLGGERLDKLEEREKAVAIEMNTIPVPNSWRKSLNGIGIDEDGRYQLIFDSDTNGGWIAINGETTFIYTEDFGLERKKNNEST